MYPDGEPEGGCCCVGCAGSESFGECPSLVVEDVAATPPPSLTLEFCTSAAGEFVEAATEAVEAACQPSYEATALVEPRQVLYGHPQDVSKADAVPAAVGPNWAAAAAVYMFELRSDRLGYCDAPGNCWCAVGWW